MRRRLLKNSACVFVALFSRAAKSLRASTLHCTALHHSSSSEQTQSAIWGALKLARSLACPSLSAPPFRPHCFPLKCDKTGAPKRAPLRARRRASAGRWRRPQAPPVRCFRRSPSGAPVRRFPAGKALKRRPANCRRQEPEAGDSFRLGCSGWPLAGRQGGPQAARPGCSTNGPSARPVSSVRPVRPAWAPPRRQL